MPKVPTTPFRDSDGEPTSTVLGGGRYSLSVAVSHKSIAHIRGPHRSFRSSEQLFVCHRGQQNGKAVSKQRLAHWIVEVVALAYQSQGELCPLGVRAHSTRSVASFHAFSPPVQFPRTVNPGGILQAPPAVRLGGAV